MSQNITNVTEHYKCHNLIKNNYILENMMLNHIWIIT
jgi:hypothetical protein